MRMLALSLALLSLPLLLGTASAQSEARVVNVDGSLHAVLPDDPAGRFVGPGEELPAGSRLTAAAGSRARIEFPGLGVLVMIGPSTVELTEIDGVRALVVKQGDAIFDYGSGDVILQVDRGRLRLGGVCGYTGTLVRGTSVIVSGDAESASVRARKGSMLLSRDADHVRLMAGETSDLPAFEQQVGEQGGRLRLHEVEIQLPPEAAKARPNSGDPYLEEMERVWMQERESPRIP